MPFVQYLQETSAMIYWRYVINNVVIILMIMIMIIKTRLLTKDIPHSYGWSLIPTKSQTHLNSSLQCTTARQSHEKPMN